jgi:type I restriction enzyme S subunit
VSGATPSRDEPSFWNGNIPWITPKELSKLDDPVIKVTQEMISEPGYKRSSCEILPVGSVLLSSRAPIGHLAIAGIRMCTNQGFKSLVPNPGVASKYLYWALQAHKEGLINLGRGATFKEVSKPIVEDFELPFPPTEIEQKCIADILDKADAIRRKRQEALRLTDDILRSVFIDKFGEPMTNSRNLPMKPLNRFGEIVTGNTPPRVNPANFGGSLEWIKSDNINTPSYYLSPASEHLSEEGTASARRVPANSILVTCIAGSLSCIGNAAIADREVAFREVAFNQQINAIIPKPDVDHRFLFTQLLIAQNHVQNASTKAMKGMISKSAFSAIEFIAPSASEQQNFGAYFDEIGIVRQKAAESLRHAENLFAALQQQAFSGQL